MTEEEVRVINHRLFQRLRKIRQNGLLHLVFPSATHTRFEHSLGVLFVADSMLTSLIFNSASAIDKNKVAKPSEEANGLAVDLSAYAPEKLHSLFRIARISALVHDLGHGPLSHTFNDFAPHADSVLAFLNEPAFKSLLPFKEVFKNYCQEHSANKQDPVRIAHEVMSCLLFAKIWHEVGSNDDTVPVNVAATLIGAKSWGLASAEFKKWAPLAHDLVASAPADADRMDYLERDSRSCGVSYGLFDRNRLLKSMLCCAEERSGEKHYRLGIKLSGVPAVENFIQARFELFVQVYYHKTNSSIGQMLDKISQYASESSNVIEFNNLDELAHGYENLGDDRFMDILRGQDNDEAKKMGAEIRTLATAVHDRQLWKRIYDLRESWGGGDYQTTEDAKKKAQEILKRLKARLPELEKDLFVVPTPPKATKDLEDGAKVLQQDRNGLYSVSDQMTWDKASTIIASLKRQEEQLFRIYLHRHEPILAKEAREAALKIQSDIQDSSIGQGQP